MQSIINPGSVPESWAMGSEEGWPTKSGVVSTGTTNDWPQTNVSSVEVEVAPPVELCLDSLMSSSTEPPVKAKKNKKCNLHSETGSFDFCNNVHKE